MRSVVEIISKVLDEFFDLNDQDKTIYIGKSDSIIIADVIQDTLKKEGII